MKKMGLIFLNIDTVKQETGLVKIQKLIGLKTNEDLVKMSKFEMVIDNENYNDSLYEMFSGFEEWVKNAYENKFVTFEQKDIKDLIEACKMVNYKPKTRDFYKVMGYQFWDIQNEISYRMGLKKDGITLDDLLSIYGISFVGNKESARDNCFNTYSLVTHFKLDLQRNKEVFSLNTPHNKQTKKREVTIPVLDFKPIRITGEEMLKQKMEEGWKISIECKSKGIGYGMLYEATAYPLHDSLEDRLSVMRFGVGKTLEELLNSLFEEEDNPYVQQKREEYKELQMKFES